MSSKSLVRILTIFSFVSGTILPDLQPFGIKVINIFWNIVYGIVWLPIFYTKFVNTRANTIFGLIFVPVITTYFIHMISKRLAGYSMSGKKIIVFLWILTFFLIAPRHLSSEGVLWYFPSFVAFLSAAT